MFPMTKLKQKFNKFRAKWKLFKELIDSTGFGCDPEKNIVDAIEEDWARKIVANKEYKQFRKRGCDHFELLCEIFNETITTEYVAPTQGPLNSEEEQEDAQRSKKSIYDKAGGPSKEEECVGILDKMEGITVQFVDAICEFKDTSIRIIVLRISGARQGDWVQSVAQ